MSISKKPTPDKESKNQKKDKTTSGGGKDVNEGGRPASEIKHGKGETTGSKGSQG